ncbi:PREDICTED: F-box protein SKIP19-like [Fragaria vesca subsp. vesca]|uniref:F-box protein SKIP19-like n=1 Tax=Fragaria vesca subsp. vesca TaxID=101020 RepID=UPI0002C2DD49|nr:PREDICTED: F-box protein SKIP19-like [Fragaria vesca subsp. vesca]
MAKSPCQTYRRRTRSYRNWLELPEDVTASILSRLDAIAILTRAQKVCMKWRRICKDRLMWRTIDMRNDGFLRDYDFYLEKMCRHGVDLSSGGLVDINVEHFGTDELLKYITNSSSGIRRLRLVCCYGITDEGLIEVASKLPLLEHLEISFNFASAQSLEVIGRACPLLKLLKLNKYGYVQIPVS